MGKVKMNTTNMDNWIKNETRKMMRHAAKASAEVAEIRMHSYVAYWYRYYGNSDHVYSSIANSIKSRAENIRSEGDYVKMDVILSFDASMYAANTAHYSIYRPTYAGGDAMTDDQKFALTFGQQWSDGVIGLPHNDRNGREWPHIQASISLEDFASDLFRAEWKGQGTKRMIAMRINKMI